MDNWTRFAVRMAEALKDPKGIDAEELEPLWNALSPEEQSRFETMLADIKAERDVP